MADDINKKISIDIEINNDGQQQVQQYKAAFDDLQNSITALSKPITDLSNSINALNTQNQTLAASGNKVKESVAGLSETFRFFQPLIKAVKDGMISLEEELSGGLAILITFAPEILKFITSLINGKEAITQAKLSLDTLNKALQSSDYSNAIKQMNELKINVGLAKKGFLDKKEVLEQYNNTLGKTMGKTTDLNKAEAFLVSKGGDYIKMTLLKAEAQLALQDAAQKALEAEQEKLKPDADVLTWWDKTTAVLKGIAYNSAGVDGFAIADEEKAQKAVQRRSDAISDIGKQKDAYLAIAPNFENQAAKIAEKSGFDFFSGTITPTGKPKKQPNKNPVPPKTNDGTSPLATDIPINHAAGDPPPDADDSALLSQKVNSGPNPEEIKTQQFAAELNKRMADEDKARQEKKEKDKQLNDFEMQMAQQLSSAAFSILQNSIQQQSEAKIAGLEKDKAAALSNTSLTGAQKAAIEQQYKAKENQVKVKAFKEEQEASIAQAVINGALAVTKATSQTGVLSAFVVPGIIAETAVEIAKIAAQKPPAYAKGGMHYTSDGRGGLLPGYSRTDNTNAYLRSGEGIVVSEAMRDPWARNLVSAINVGFGGRDFSTTVAGRGFAVGGIFTDGGNTNRYYNQPVNDNKNLANTIAYQMVNNFPPVYVDVKDINNQQNILAQTINRVNL